MHRMKRIFLLALLLVGAFRSSAATNVWFSPTGTGDGSTAERARRWDVLFVSRVLLSSRPGTDPDVTLHFLPGEYLTEPVNTAATKPSPFRLSMIGHGARPEDVVLKLKPNYPMGSDPRGYQYVSVVDLARNQEYLRRFVAENLTFDGNWDAQTDHNSTAYLRGYKNSPLWARARTGRIRKVIVRNHGAHGLMPQMPGDSPSGVEIFPLTVFTIDEGQAPEDGDAAPWVVEDCEISGLHSVYWGYATMVMAQAAITADTPKASLDDPKRRLILVRRCQVRGIPAHGAPIGFGTAGGTLWDGRGFSSGRVVFADNVVLNAGAGLNVDTGITGPLEVTNSVFLDVGTTMYCGTVGKYPQQSGFTVSGNSVRLVGRLPMKLYRDIGPGDVLGEQYSRDASGLIVNGVLDRLDFSGNWITARPRSQFDVANPGPGANARFRVLHKVAPETVFDDAAQPAMPRFDGRDVAVLDNAVSETAFDFGAQRRIKGGRHPSFGPRTEPALQNLRATTVMADGFEPAGAVERVRLRVFPDGRFIGAEEIVLGRPERPKVAGMLSVRARLAIQPTPASRLKGTQPIKGRRLWLEVLPGSRHPQRLSADTDATGFATFSYPVDPRVDGVDRYRAWADGPDGKTDEWDEFEDAWATASAALGTTVSVSAQPDVADARYGRPARLKFVRTGRLDRALTANWTTSPGAEAARAGRDFTVRNANGTQVVFPVGQAELVVELVPREGKPHESRVTAVTIAPGEGYAPGEIPSASVVVYDPPPPTSAAPAK